MAAIFLFDTWRREESEKVSHAAFLFPGANPMDELTDLVFPYTARVQRLSDATRRTDLLALLEASGAVDAGYLEEQEPFFWGAEISNDQVDFYYTHMLVSTLRNYTADARTGVSFLNSHRQRELPIGQSLDGQFIENAERTSAKARMSVLADFYTFPGLTLNEVSTDDFIAGVRGGIIRDVSVGFFGGEYWCDICRGNYLSYQCSHIAGFKYEVKDEGTEAARQVVCTVGIDNARLAEVSAVFDGATPNAAIIKAERMAEAGELSVKAAQVLESRYRVKLPVKRSFAGVETPGKETPMDFEKLVNDIRAALAIDEQADIVGAVIGLAAEAEQLRSAGERVTELEAQVAELTPRAKDGETYRNDLIGEAEAEGVRAYGDRYNSETYRAIMQRSDLAAIKQLRDDWRQLGDIHFPGGRQSQDEGEAPRNGQRSSRVPAKAYEV